MSYNYKKLEQYRADALAGRSFKCATCPYCNGERDPTVKHIHPSTKPSNPWDFWRGILLDKYRNVQSPAAKHNASLRFNPPTAAEVIDANSSSSAEKVFVVGPMVDQSELPFRMLCRQYGATLAYTPMLHAKSFAEGAAYRRHFFTTTPVEEVRAAVARGRAQAEMRVAPDGAAGATAPQSATPRSETNGIDADMPHGCELLVDRPCIVQFCGNDADTVLQAARYAVRGEYTDPNNTAAIRDSAAEKRDGTEPFYYLCDAVDLNLGCPQGIARRGHYGSFLMEDWDTVHTVIHTLHVELEVPVTAKIRVFDMDAGKGVSQSTEAGSTSSHVKVIGDCRDDSTGSSPSTSGKVYDEVLSLYYAQMVRDAGAQLLCIHGRTREMKGQQSGLANLALIGAIRRGLGGTIPVLSNGNVLRYEDVLTAISETGCDGHMCAEALLWDPALFANPALPVLSGRLPLGADKCTRIAGVRTALDYVLWLRKYPVDNRFVKAHLFKMCFHSYELHVTFRDALGQLRTNAKAGAVMGSATGEGGSGEGDNGGFTECTEGAHNEDSGCCDPHDASHVPADSAEQQLDALEAHLKALLAAEEASDVVGEQPKTAQAEKKAAKAQIADVFDEEGSIGLELF